MTQPNQHATVGEKQGPIVDENQDATVDKNRFSPRKI